MQISVTSQPNFEYTSGINQTKLATFQVVQFIKKQFKRVYQIIQSHNDRMCRGKLSPNLYLL